MRVAEGHCQCAIPQGFYQESHKNMKNFRAFFIGLLLIPVVAVGALFYIQGPDGNPLMNMGKLRQSLGSVDLDWSLIEKARQAYYTIRDNVKNVKAETPPHEALNNARKPHDSLDTPPETLYKWRDKDGNWHFSDQRPQDSVEFEIIESD
jgi:hypothetical protein